VQSPPLITSKHERALVEMAQWFARIQQYSASHAACADLGVRAHRTFEAALAEVAPLVVTVSKDAMVIGDAPAVHPVLRGRLAPYLHERGVSVVRIGAGVTVAELTSLLDLLTLPVQTTFDRGGVAQLVKERGVVRIEVEDLAHDITEDERHAQRRRARLRITFGDLLQLLRARQGVHGIGDHVRELLDNPQVAVALLEENPLTVAEAVAGLCLLVREEQEKTGEVLAPKLRVILSLLSAAGRARVVLGLAPLPGEFREALVWGLDTLDEEALARFVLPSFRSAARELDIVFYAIGLAAPHDGRRFSMLRFLGLRLHDLPADDPEVLGLLETLAVRPEELSGSSWRERDLLAAPASRVLELRRLARVTPPEARAPEGTRDAFDARAPLTELVRLASRTRRFGQVCASLPGVAARYAADGALDAVLGIVRGLREVTRAEVASLARRTLVDVISAPVAAQLLRGLDETCALAEGATLDDVTANVKLIAELRPEVVLDRLELSESRKMRRVLIDALGAVGAPVAPFVRAKLHSPSWFVVRNAVGLLPACGGTASDFLPLTRHPNEKVRAEILRALRSVPLDEGINAVLVEILADPIPDNRARAAMMLRGDLLVARSVARVAELLATPDLTDELKRRLVLALGKSRHDEAASALFDVLQPKGLLDTGALRELAADALRTSPAAAAARHFDEGLRSSSFRVRRACEKALEKVPGGPRTV
jgi:hypothetical protein